MRLRAWTVVIMLCAVAVPGLLVAQIQDLDESGTWPEGDSAVRPLVGGGEVYWVETETFRRAPLAGFDQEILFRIEGVFPRALAIDFEMQKLYWSQIHVGVDATVHRANLDGSEAEVLLSSDEPGVYRTLVFDSVHGKLYWTYSAFGGTGEVGRANPDGSDPETLIDNVRASGLALDPESDELYYSSEDEIYKATLDGNDSELIGGEHVKAVSLDLERRKLYWMSVVPSSIPEIPPFGSYHRSDLDGSNEELIKNACGPMGLAIDPRRGLVYTSSGCIPFYFTRASVDDLTFETFLYPSRQPHSIVLDLRSPDADEDGIDDEIDRCLDTIIPEAVPTNHLGVNRWALVDDDGLFDTTPPAGGGTGPDFEFTIENTAGCSCEQIIEAMGLGWGHTKFGCSTGAMLQWIAAVGGYNLAEPEAQQETSGLGFESLMEGGDSPSASASGTGPGSEPARPQLQRRTPRREGRQK